MFERCDLHQRHQSVHLLVRSRIHWCPVSDRHQRMHQSTMHERATCINLLNYYSCACTSGFTGNQCQTNVNECSSTPCYNGGTCIDGVNMYQCVCPAGFNGPTCAQDINECLSSPCLNNATCLNLIAKFSCVCPTGFQGQWIFGSSEVSNLVTMCWSK